MGSHVLLFSLRLFCLSDKCLLVLQPLMFCLSVRSRWEMQEGAELDDEEKTMVEELQKAGFVRGRGMQEDPPEADERLKNETQRDTEPSDETAGQ